METKEKTEQEMDSLMEKVLDWQRVEGKRRAVVVLMMDDEIELAMFTECGKFRDVRNLYGMHMEREDAVLHHIVHEEKKGLMDWLKRKLLKN